MLAPGGPSYFLQPRALEPPLFYAEGRSLENLPAVSDAELALENAFPPSKSGKKSSSPIHGASQAHRSASNPATPPDGAPLQPASAQADSQGGTGRTRSAAKASAQTEGAFAYAVADGGGSVADRWNLDWSVGHAVASQWVLSILCHNAKRQFPLFHCCSSTSLIPPIQHRKMLCQRCATDVRLDRNNLQPTSHGADETEHG